MAGFADKMASLDDAIEDGLTDPAMYFAQGAGEGVSIGVMLERPTNEVRMGEAGFVLEQPTMEIRHATVPGLAANDVVVFDGQRWRIEGAPERPGDGAWWRAIVADIGAAS
jgi:hypothetical protein